MLSSCFAVVCSFTLITVNGSGPGAPCTVTLCCCAARLSSELNNCENGKQLSQRQAALRHTTIQVTSGICLTSQTKMAAEPAPLQQSNKQTVRNAGLLMQHTPCRSLWLPVYIQALKCDIRDLGTRCILKLLKHSDRFPGHAPRHKTPQLWLRLNCNLSIVKINLKEKNISGILLIKWIRYYQPLTSAFTT